MLVRALQPFCRLEDSSLVVVTVPAGDIERVREMLETHLDQSAVRILEGGGSRQESVFIALAALEPEAPETVLIHDGARPWISLELAERVLAGCRRYGACVPVMEVSEAPKQVDPSGFILAHLDRQSLRVAQTPQGFSFPRLLEAYRAAAASGRRFIDDAELYSAFIGPVMTVPGELRNRKVTYREDL